MKLIVCLDDKGGMLFNKRRQSSDREVIANIRAICADRPLWMCPYSAKLFQTNDNIRASEDYLERAGEDDFCFVEYGDLSCALKTARMLIIYRWNRVYPADVKFPGSLPPVGWKCIGTTDFPGHSHEKITQEVYTREDE